jgi:hypothetical protein
MRRSCNTSVARRAAPGSVSGIWACVGLLGDQGTAGRYLSLGDFSRHEHENARCTPLARDATTPRQTAPVSISIPLFADRTHLSAYEFKLGLRAGS